MRLKELRKSETEEEKNLKRTRRAKLFTKERQRQRSLIPRLEKIEVEYTQYLTHFLTFFQSSSILFRWFEAVVKMFRYQETEVLLIQ